MFTLYYKSLSQIGEIIVFENKFIEYRTNDRGLQRSIEIINLKPVQVQEFQNQYHVHFDIKLEDMPVNRFESKLVRVNIGLIGATSSEPFDCRLIHFGPTKSKLRDESIIDRTDNPKHAVIQVSTTIEKFEAPMPDLSDEALFKQEFWGRSPAASWFLEIEEDQFQAKEIDLSNLSEIKIAVSYEFFT